jgi:hypothetical protein
MEERTPRRTPEGWKEKIGLLRCFILLPEPKNFNNHSHFHYAGASKKKGEIEAFG